MDYKYSCLSFTNTYYIPEYCFAWLSIFIVTIYRKLVENVDLLY